MTEVDRRTTTIEFTRQLWPNPPKDARPWFCYIKTLIFYEKGTHEEVWRQEIPECDQLMWDKAKMRVCNIHVEYTDDRFGWVLKYSIDHETADLVVKYLLWKGRRRMRAQLKADREYWARLEKVKS